MKLELIILRHGETEWTLSGQHTGITEIALTSEGEKEAEDLAQILLRLLHGRIPAVYVSPRQRAVQTAKLSMPNVDFSIEPLIAEYVYGQYEGLTPQQIEARSPGWNIWRDGCPGGETTAEVGARADRFLASAVVSASTPVVAVTHGHFSRILAARALGRPPEEGSIFASSTASVSVVKDKHDKPSLYLWNLTSNL